MRSTRVLSAGVAVGFLLGLVWAAVPPPAHAVWNVGGQFKVGGQLRAITPTATTLPDGTFVDPTCDTQGGTSLAIVQSSKLAGVDPTLGIVLVVSCLDNGGTATAAARRARLNFLNPADGKVLKAISTTTTPSNGWAHLVHRPDKGDLLACGNDGTIYSIDFSQFNSTPDGTATLLPRPAGLPTNCAGLAWDPEENVIYQGVTGGTNTVGVHRFKDGTTTDLGNFSTPCPPIGVAITGGVLVVACNGASTMLRLDKTAGTILGVNGTLGVLGLAAGTSLNPGLGDLACDPVTFQKDPTTGKDQFTDALWSRRGANGNGAVALELPAFTCGLPSNAIVLAAGLSAPAVPGGPAGAVPLAACFDANGKVKDSDGDGLPDCWETSGIDFDGNGTVDLTLCVQVDTNGDGVADGTECANANHKDLFVEINWMQNHKPDPLALSQTQSVASVGVKSVREAFGAAPVSNPDATTGVRIHFQVKDSPVTLNTLADAPGTSPSVREVTELVFTPCTPPEKNPNGTLNVKSLSDSADFDAIKKLNFGTVAEQAGVNTLNAKRLAFRYVLFAHKQTGSNQLGSTASGCSEVGGDDAATTLGSFTATTVGGLTHNRGTTDQQAGTFMHEFGHLLGLRHGGGDNDNCKPNYLSVMSYTRQIAGSPIPSRRLDYSRAELPALGLSETNLSEPIGLCSTSSASSCDPTLGPLPPFFPSADQAAFGPSVWSVTTANTPAINWSKNKTKQGAPIIETTPVSGNINQGSGGCDGSDTLLKGHDDWSGLLYRASAALDFAGGFHSATQQEHTSLTKEQEEQLFAAADLDGNGVGDAQDCAFTATGITNSPVAATTTSVPIGTDPITRGFAAAGTAFLGTDSISDDFSYTGTDSNGFTGVTGVSNAWPSGTTVTGALSPTGVTSSPVDPAATSVAIGANPTTRGFAAAGTAFLGSSSNSDAFSYTGTDNNSFTGVTGVSAAWPSATTVTGPACTHRIDIKPSAPADSTGAKTVSLGAEATVTVAIFAEVDPSTPNPVAGDGLWDPTTEVLTACLQPATSTCLTFSVESLNLPVKTNKNGQGTCSARDVADPTTGVKDGFKDMLCQFPTTGLPLGKHTGVVSGFFLDPASGEIRAFRARQDFIVAK